MGQSPPGSSYNTEGVGVPFFQGKADFTEKSPTVRTWCTQPKKFAKAGDILISVRAPIGPTNVADRDCSIGRGLAAIRPKNGIPTEYILYYLELKEPELALSGTGSTFTAIKKENLANLSLPLPPLAEQQRIVTRLEALLSHVDAAGDRLSRVPAIMKRFRQSVLAAACSGRLTEEWREENPSTDNSDQLLIRVSEELQNYSVKSKKNSVVQLSQWEAPEQLEIFDIPDNWTWIAVKDSTYLLQYGISVKADSDEKSGIPILRMGNIQEGLINLTNLKFIPANTESISNFIVETGDILFNRTNSPELVGKSAVYNEKLRAVFASYLIRVRPNSNLILSDYLCWWINSMWGREWARIVRTDGVSQSNINAQKLSVMPVPLPPLDEQREIVRRVGLLFERADAIEREVAAAGRRCERLTQAVLGKAFRGELTRNDDEPN